METKKKPIIESAPIYSDHLIAFNVNRDNATTEGEAFICISGYFIDV